jgi:16S rRNA processing protein RimM
VFGVRGWVKVFSYTEPREKILDYQPWLLTSGDGWREVAVLDGRMHGKGVVAHLEGVDDRDAAAALMDTTIAVGRDRFAALKPGEYYHTDLVGLDVETVDGVALGKVSHLFATGANQVMVVQGERERLVPFVQEQVVRAVDIDTGRITVDWDPEF